LNAALTNNYGIIASFVSSLIDYKSQASITIILSKSEFYPQNWSTQQARKFDFKGKIIVPKRQKEI